jgi:serine/threonine protein kinase/tetratricopeptide (TPR) repeat protein
MNDNELHVKSPTTDTRDSLSVADALDAGLAAGFGANDSISVGTDRASVLQLPGQSIRRVPRVLLKTPVDAAEAPDTRPLSSEMPAVGPESRYRLDGEIARGGMGVIIRGRDTDLGRDLAIKVMLDSQKSQPDSVERFVEEAQIGAQLQHPGIVPVYELGQFPDQRPFFTMKLVKGKNLSALLAQRRTPSDDRARFLGIFEQVCQTVAYAHSRGVIHRDLKPANVMVGAFGEVQVMDWGCAKVLRTSDGDFEGKTQDTQHATGAIQTIRSDDRETTGTSIPHTQLGSILGTPAYMAPEQAAGAVDSLDERADVFGLGAILCEILTGQPPYVRQDRSQALQLARDGQLDECLKRMAACGADQRLLAIVRGCLAVNRQVRYRDAGLVSQHMTDYFESTEQRLRQVELDRIEARTRADEERKRRRFAVALAVLTMLTCGAIGGGWLWMTTKDAALAVQKARIGRQISGELVTARALLGNIDAGSLPDSQALTRALRAARRAQSLLATGQYDEQLPREVKELLDALEAQDQDQRLQAALESIWEWEMDRMAEAGHSQGPQVAFSNQAFFAADSAAPHEVRVAGLQATMPAVAGAARRYEEAFAKWGLRPDETPVAAAARRIQALHPARKSPVLVSLDRWRRLLGTPRSLQDWEQASWSVLESVALTSRGGDSLQVQPDGSILARGDHPQRGYDLVLETEQQAIVALRLEAMLDDSLPNRGPGRGREGVFAIDGLRVSYASRANPNLERRLEFRSAMADYADPYYPLSTESWIISGGGGQAHMAVFEAQEPIHSDSGFRLTISHQDRDARWWGGENWNLGRFRWSASAGRQDEHSAQWLAKVVAGADRDPWRRSMRAEIQQGDIAALIRRASDLQKIRDQPAIILVELAHVLLEINDAVLFRTLPDTIHWEVLRPIAIESEGGATLTLQNDGSVFSSGRNPWHDRLIVMAPVGDRPLTAIRLETIPDPRLPFGGAGRTEGGQISLAELTAEVHPASHPEPKERLVIGQAVADFMQSSSLSISKAIDGLPLTASRIPSGHRQSHSAVFLATPVKERGEMTLRICLETGRGFAGPGRFRLSVSRDTINLPDPKHTALTLLQHIQQRHPDSYWVNLALAEAFYEQTPPAFDEAIRYATVARALRPEKAMAHAQLLRVLPPHQLDSEQPLGKLALFHASRLRELDADNTYLRQAATQQAERGVLLKSQGRLAEAIATYNVAIAMQPKFAMAHFLRGNILAEQGKLEEAIDAYRASLRIDPHLFHSQYEICHVLLRQGKPDQAIVGAQKALDLCPVSPGAHRALYRALIAKGRLNEATELGQKGLDLARYQGMADEILEILRGRIESGSRDPSTHFEVGAIMAEEGELDAAIDAFRDALELEPEHGLALYYLANTLRRQGKLAEAIRTYRRCAAVHPEYAHACRGLGIVLAAQGKFPEARRALQKSMNLSGGGGARDWFFVAISEWHLGNPAKARRWYDRAVRWMDENDPENDRLIEARAEAEKMLGLKKSGIDQVE